MVGIRDRTARATVRFLGMAGTAALAVVLLACDAEAHEPGATDLAAVTTIVDELAVAEDPRRELAELPAEARQAVIDYLKLETTETSGGGGPTTPIDAPDHCERQVSGYVARNAYGRELWTYQSITEWCWADGLITTAPVFTISAEIHVPLWEFAGHIERRESGGQGEAEHADVAEGLFRLCPEAPDDCIQDERVRVDKWQDGDGGYGAETSGIDYSPDRSSAWASPAFYLAFLVYIPLAVTPLIAGRVMRRNSPRGSGAWGLGVVATALGVLVALHVAVFVVYTGVFSIGSLVGSGSTSVSATTSVTQVEVVDVPIEETAVVPVETTPAAQSAGPVPAAGPPQSPPRPETCDDQEAGLTARNLFGHPVWSYRSTTWWCWDGVEITDEPNVSGWHTSHAPFWNLIEAERDRSSGGQGHWDHTDFTRIEFELCLPLLGCVQRDYQWLEKTQNSDGTAFVEESPYQDSYPGALLWLIGPLVVALTLLVTGRVLRRGAARGALAWGFGVSATSLGLLMLTLLVITGMFLVAASHVVV